MVEVVHCDGGVACCYGGITLVRRRIFSYSEGRHKVSGGGGGEGFVVS